jgi:hypothetical protein
MQKILQSLEQVDGLKRMLDDTASILPADARVRQSCAIIKAELKSVGEHLEAQIRDAFLLPKPPSAWIRRVRPRISSPREDAPGSLPLVMQGVDR